MRAVSKQRNKKKSQFLSKNHCTNARSMKLKVEIDPKEDSLYQRRQELLEDCKKLVGCTLSGRRPLNILVVGPPGSGKSSFLNTIFASLNESQWCEHAKYGDFHRAGKQVTRRFKCYRKELYYKTVDTYLMPTFLDMTGLEDDDSELNRELLNIVLSGKIKENELLSEVISLGKSSVDMLRKKYNSRPVHKRVDRIIIVCSMNPISNLPKSLLEAVADVAGYKDITTYGVLTHVDEYPEDVDDDRELKFRQLTGIPETRLTRVMNYCPAVDPSRTYLETYVPTLDVPVLQLLRQVLLQEPGDQEELDLDNTRDEKSLSETYQICLVCFVISISIYLLVAWGLLVNLLLFLMLLISIFYIWKGQDIIRLFSELWDK